MLKTFHQWSSEGYKIKKGEKARGKTSEGFMFDESQVIYSPSYPSTNSTFRGCAPKGNAQLWGDFEDNPDETDNPLTHDWIGRRY